MLKHFDRTLLYVRYRITWQRRGWRRPGESPISFSQVNEDLVLEALLGPIRSFIDIGANDGVSCSNTARFALQGATGIAFEPVPATFARLRGFYRLNPRVHCVNSGVSEAEGTGTMSGDGLHARIAAPAQNERPTLVKLEPLTNHLRHRPALWNADLVSIDVEGHELSVLRGAGFPKLRARCFLVETHAGTHPHFAEIDELLANQGYREVLRNHLNSFYCPAGISFVESPSSISSRFARYVALDG